MSKRIPEYILKNLRQRLGLNENDTSKDYIFNDMSLKNIVEEYLSWEGIIGYGNLIVDIVTDLQNNGIK